MLDSNQKNICQHCGLIFENLKLKANHIRWNHKQNKYSPEGLDKIKKSTKLNNEIKYGKKIKEDSNCHICGSNITIEYRINKKKEKYFCSKKCSNTRFFKHTEKTKEKISNKIKENIKNNGLILKNVGKRIFSSKGEMEIRNFFIENFPNDEWTFGGNIHFGGEMISRDLYSNKLKVVIEYDGIWHFKNINNQLSRKQKKDLLLEKWVILNDWRLIRVKEDVYVKNKKEIMDLIINLTYNTDQKIIKLY